MNGVLLIVAFIVLVAFYIRTCSETFYIEPNTVTGGAMPDSGMILTTNGKYEEYNAPLELEGPGDAAWSGY
jgi:hypothetical protein